MICPYCQNKCLYHDHGYGIENIIDLLIPVNIAYTRRIEIDLNNWKFTANIFENEILVGKIFVNRLDKPEDYSIDNYFIIPSYAFSIEEYVAKLVNEIKMFYEAAEFHDGEHPIIIKVNITL